ncbi:MAG: hypothetical protein AAF693_08370 [Bacteroidota bacterium]
MAFLYLSYKKLIYRGELNTIEIRNSFNQIQSLLNLIRKVKFRDDLPRTRGFASSPDFLNIVHKTIKDTNPSSILECGSGLSTLVIGYAIEDTECLLVSLEQSEEETQKTQRLIQQHQLNFKHRVYFAPLKEYGYGSWYDLEKISFPSSLDIIIVDGPYEKGKYGIYRQHAIKILERYINKNTVIILDDANRDKYIINMWKKQYSINVEYLPTEKGTALISFA